MGTSLTPVYYAFVTCTDCVSGTVMSLAPGKTLSFTNRSCEYSK